MQLFKKIINKTKKEQLIDAAKAARLAINDIKFNEDGLCFINPNHQDCLNFGWYTEKDIEHFLKGEGNIIKGKTPEEKQKFYQYYKFNIENPQGWCLSWHYMQHFDKIVSYKYEIVKNYSLNTTNATPIKITKNNQEEIISKMFGDFSDALTRDLLCSYRKESFDNQLEIYDRETWGVKKTLFNLGIGYFGSSNTPEEIQNLNWIADIAKFKAIYNYYLKQDIQLPDFKFVYENRYKM